MIFESVRSIDYLCAETVEAVHNWACVQLRGNSAHASPCFPAGSRSAASGGAQAVEHPQRCGRHPFGDRRVLGQVFLWRRAAAGFLSILQWWVASLF